MQEKRKLKKKIPIKDLFFVYIGNRILGSTLDSKEIIIATKKTTDFHTSFHDVITNNKYYLASDLKAQLGDLVGFNPISLITCLKESTYKDEILKKGYITLEEAINFYNSINRKKNHSLTTLNDKKLIHPNCCVIVNTIPYDNKPSISERDSELRELMISLALNKKIAALTGYKGVGKTHIIYLLNYMITNKIAPDFLHDKLLISINLDKLSEQNDTTQTIKDIITFAKNNNGILILDDIKDINDELVQKLFQYIKSNKIKLIITTGNIKLDEQDFDTINIKEPKEEVIKEILNNLFTSCNTKYNISIDEINPHLESIISVLIEATKPRYLNISNTDKNPKLCSKIINDAFLIAKVDNSKNLTIDHLIETVNSKETELGQQIKQEITTCLNDLKPKQKTKQKGS